MTPAAYAHQQRRTAAQSKVRAATSYSWGCSLTDQQLDAIAAILELPDYSPLVTGQKAS